MKRSIYISRPVLNAHEIREWAQKCGFASCLSNKAMHVTVAFDHKKRDWAQLPLGISSNRIEVMTEDRSVTLFRNGAVVIEIFSEQLRARWEEFHQAGLHWKYEDYRPHITFTYALPIGLDLGKVVPFAAPIYLGPERVSEVVWNQHHSLTEVAFQPSPPPPPPPSPSPESSAPTP